MFEAARVSDQTNHRGVLMPIGHPTVIIENKPACTRGDLHSCPLEPSISPIATGSSTVLIGGLYAARVSDTCFCGAGIIPPCAPTVLIGVAGVPYANLSTQNCYGWASGVIDFRQPGGGLSSLADMNVNSIKTKLTSDLGLPMTNPSLKSLPGMHKIAIYNYADIDPNKPRLDSSGNVDWDFHVWKQDPDGYWSQKPGSTEIKRFDYHGNPITDPASSDRGHYTEYVGTWQVPD